MKYDYQKIKKQVQAEADLYVKFGNTNIWSFILKEIFNNDTIRATKFMLSSEGGGYTENQLKRIIDEKKRFE